MALVYRAVHITTHRQVAVKVLRQEYRDNPEFLRRFEREARAVLHLSHDNIVRAYGVGQYEGVPYIVMEYVAGGTSLSRLWVVPYARRAWMMTASPARFDS